MWLDFDLAPVDHMQDVELSLAVRDAYGNAIIALAPGALRATATGAEGATDFQAAEVGICSLAYSSSNSPHLASCYMHGWTMHTVLEILQVLSHRHAEG